MVSQTMITWAVVSLPTPLATKMNWTRSLPLQIPSNPLKPWMNRNRYHMNNAKTEVPMIDSQSQLNNWITTALDVNGMMVQRSKMIIYLGTYLDNGLSFKHHILTKCRIAIWNLKSLKLFWPSFTVQACITLVLKLVISHLDYINSAFIGLQVSDINKM